MPVGTEWLTAWATFLPDLAICRSTSARVNRGDFSKDKFQPVVGKTTFFETDTSFSFKEQSVTRELEFEGCSRLIFLRV